MTRISTSIFKKATATAIVAVAVSLLSGPASGQDAEFSPEQIEFFENSVRPLLAESCYECHQGTKAKLGLKLDSRAGVLKGSDYHPVVDLENPSASRLLLAVKHAGAAQKIENMPKKGEPLSAEQVAVLERWISEGLPWPTESITGAGQADDPENHWAWL